MTVEKLTEERRQWANELLTERHGDVVIYSRGAAVDASKCEGFVLFEGDKPVGLLMYVLGWSDLQVLTLDLVESSIESARKLIEAAVNVAKNEESRSIVVVLRNDQIEDMTAYQLQGFRLSSVKRGAVAQARQKNPAIPRFGKHGIEVMDEIELSMGLK